VWEQGTSADRQTALYCTKGATLFEVPHSRLCGEWVRRTGHNQHTKPGWLRKQRGSNAPVLWEAGTALAAAALFATVCVVTGLQNAGD